MRSLEHRFVIGLAVVLLVLFSLLLWASAQAVRSLGEAYVLTRLEHDAEALIAAYGYNARGELRLREGRISPIYQQPLSGHYYVLLSGTRPPTRSRSLWDESLQTAPLAPGQVRVATVSGPGGQRLLVRHAGYEKAGQDLTLLVAEDLTPLTQQIRDFQLRAFLVLGLSVLSVIVAQRYLLRRGFRALDRVRHDVRQIAQGKRQQIAELGPTEVQPLTNEVNRLLRQLQQRLQRSRNALGNLAHALKGPLSLLTHDVKELPIDHAQRAQLSGQLERIGQLITRELRRARFAGDSAGQRFIPSQHIPPLLESIDQLYRDRNLRIATAPLPTQMLALDYEDMLEMLGNLLDNAGKWARHRIELTVDIGREVCIRVADDGPGIADEQRAALLGRGHRLDEHKAGHGLGLAIVRDLIDDYNGSLMLGRSRELGGLEAVVRLPLPTSDETAKD